MAISAGEMIRGYDGRQVAITPSMLSRVAGARPEKRTARYTITDAAGNTRVEVLPAGIVQHIKRADLERGMDDKSISQETRKGYARRHSELEARRDAKFGFPVEKERKSILTADENLKVLYASYKTDLPAGMQADYESFKKAVKEGDVTLIDALLKSKDGDDKLAKIALTGKNLVGRERLYDAAKSRRKIEERLAVADVRLEALYQERARKEERINRLQQYSDIEAIRNGGSPLESENPVLEKLRDELSLLDSKISLLQGKQVRLGKHVEQVEQDRQENEIAVQNYVDAMKTNTKQAADKLGWIASHTERGRQTKSTAKYFELLGIREGQIGSEKDLDEVLMAAGHLNADRQGQEAFLANIGFEPEWASTIAVMLGAGCTLAAIKSILKKGVPMGQHT